ncbi:MAG: chemotaxis protein CheB [Pirellulaceae bacterium]
MERRAEAVVMGASVGAIDALSMILPVLPHDFALPLMIVVHVPPDKNNKMVELFRSKCQLPVREAEDKEPIRGGTIYFAPPDYHLLVETDRRLSLSSEEPVQYSRPSVDVLFETAVDAYGSGLVGVLLTGANDDGARGMGLVHEAGGIAVAQRPDLAYAPTMPRAALDLCPGIRALTLQEIGQLLREVSTSQ